MKIHANSLYLALGLSFLAPATLVMLTGCASDRYSLGTHGQMDDRSLQLRVATALSDNPGYQFEGVSITVYNGVVRLGGVVDLFVQKVQAGNLVMQVPGVKDVKDNITVKGQSAGNNGETDDDKSLTASVKNALDNNPGHQYEDVNVAVLQGMVQLSGFVETTDQKKRAGDLARAVPGVKNVLNNITVKVIL